jgi:streptomycin 6-kinase
LDAPPALPEFMHLWRLERDGEPFATATSILAPVRYRDGVPAMLKIATAEEERLGGELMVWWHGRGAARVLRHAGSAILLERATGMRSLASMARSGEDDAATRILCATASTLHASPTTAGDPPPLTLLEQWFAELFVHAADAAGFCARAARVAEGLLAHQREVVVLHGDLHHGNVLDFGASGWRAIDPKHVAGDRAFDFANILCNPADVVTRPGRVRRQTGVIASATGIGTDRLLAWTVAWCGLSATWEEQAGRVAEHTLLVGREAERLLG